MENKAIDGVHANPKLVSLPVDFIAVNLEAGTVRLNDFYVS